MFSPFSIEGTLDLVRACYIDSVTQAKNMIYGVKQILAFWFYLCWGFFLLSEKIKHVIFLGWKLEVVCQASRK
jgi:hypothetical protein